MADPDTFPAMTEDTRALHEHALVESVPVAAGDRIVGWTVLLRGLPIGVVPRRAGRMRARRGRICGARV